MENPSYLDELDLKNCIKITLKRKWLIAAITLVSMVAFVTPLLFEHKVYTATACITITPQNITHKIRLKSNLILNQIIQTLHLKNSSGKESSVEELSPNLTAKNAGEEGLIYLETTADSPEKAKEIANAWGSEYLKYIREISSKEIDTTENALSQQLENIRTKLHQAEEMVFNFKKTTKLDLMKKELLAKQNTLYKLQEHLTQMEFDIKLKEINLVELKNQIAAKDKQNPLFQDLEQRILENTIEINTFPAKSDYLKKSIEVITKDAIELDNNIIQKEIEFTDLLREVDARQNDYHVFFDKINSKRNDMADALGNIKIISDAVCSTHPVNHGKIPRTIALSSVLGLMLGIFLCFCVEFWQTAKKESLS